jgi:hypothetical protein
MIHFTPKTMGDFMNRRYSAEYTFEPLEMVKWSLRREKKWSI